MSDLNQTPSANRLHISFFGCRNAGKSSVVNAVTGQELSIVSDIKGTTTDPVTKSMELLPLGPVVIIDTPGIDDVGQLGEMRVQRTRKILNKTDIAVLVVDGCVGMCAADRDLVELFVQKELPYLIVYNKLDLMQGDGKIFSEGKEGAEGKEISEGQRKIGAKEISKGMEEAEGKEISEDQGKSQAEEISEIRGVSEFEKSCKTENSQNHEIWVSAWEKTNIQELKERLGALVKTDTMTRKLLGQLLNPMDFVILVCPIDESAPKGRMILPQQQAIRDVLEAGAVSIVVREHELKATLERLGEKVAMVVTDSQAFKLVGEITPDAIPLTSFSILMANYKGFLKTAVNGVLALKNLKDGDRVLIAEGCTHHRQCNDIGTVKLPNWLRTYSGKDLTFEFCSGRDFPDDVSSYALVVHCGGCMLTEREIQYRMRCTTDQGIPFTNYGTVIACVTGTLERSLRVFPEIHGML